MNDYDVAYLCTPAAGTGDDRARVLTCQNDIVIIVADGAGGSSGGAEAAKMLVDLAEAECLKNGVPDDDLACCVLLSSLDKLISQDRQAGETTAVIAVVTSTDLYGASVGDSGAWLIFPDDWYDLTLSQSRKPLLGCGFAELVPFNAELRDGTLIVATDGLWNYTAQSRIIDIARTKATSADIAEMLTSAARLPNGSVNDDVTVAICRPTDIE